MRHISLYIAFLLFVAVSLPAQVNLVPNPSFEDSTECPFNPAIEFASPWYDPNNGSSDYLHSCNSGNYGVPNNTLGHQNARTGLAYAGAYTFTNNTFVFREYIQTPLISVLLVSRSYLIDFYVSLGDTFSIATHNIGLYFSDSAITTAASGGVINVIPQVANDVVNNQLIDKIGWTKISGTYVANGSEQYITIGNFLDDSSSDTTQLSEGSYPYSYYYIDDVSVICMNCPEIQENLFIPSYISGDDFFEIQGLSENNELLIFNSLGQIIYKKQNYSNKFSALQVNTGMYYYSLRMSNGNVSKGKLLVVN